MQIGRKTTVRLGALVALLSLSVAGAGCGSRNVAAGEANVTTETTETTQAALVETPTVGDVGPTASETIENNAEPPSPVQVVTTTTETAVPETASNPVIPVADWTLEEQVGALFMVGVPAGDGTCSANLLGDRHVVGLFLSGRSQHGSQAIADQVADCRDLASAQVPLLVATDQEGGRVQVLQGEGFDQFPSAMQQSTDENLTEAATQMAAQLRSAGVDVNFAPVVDLVDESFAPNNPPIGAIQRNFGFTTETVAQQAAAFAQGMQNSDVIPTLKHFPGLGRVTVNTDFGSGVVDTETTADSDSVQVYDQIIGKLGNNPATAPWIMVSTAVYNQIDSAEPAAFSPAVIALAKQSGFNGILITDDLSDATQVAAWTPGDRAIKAIEAGIDVVLFSANIDDVPAAMDAVLDRAQNDPEFRAQVQAAAARVANVADNRSGLHVD